MPDSEIMPDSQMIPTEIQHLLQRQQTLVMATADPDGTPHSSSAPYLLHEGDFYILASRLAPHTANLSQTNCCHIQILADEQDTINPFARKRLSYPCTATELPIHSPANTELLVELRRRFGPTIDLLTALPDFCLFKLKPATGQIVLGFGQAHAAPPPGKLN